MTLVGGAVKNNLPTDILLHMGADSVIGVDNFKDMKQALLCIQRGEQAAMGNLVAIKQSLSD